MSLYRSQLPQIDRRIFLTDGGMETSLIFLEGVDLPYFASFDLLRTNAGRELTRKYYERYAAIAVNARAGFILESPTWRANTDWGRKLGYDKERLQAINKQAIALMQEVREQFQTPDTPVVISGCVGPRGDGYQVNAQMTVEEAQTYHREQIAAFTESEADMVSAITMTYPEEAAGIARAAKEAGLPVVVSFTTETDGRLPCGESLKSAIEKVDTATNGYPAYYMVNCAHPDHFRPALADGGEWLERLRGIRANASRCSHAELDEAEELDSGNPQELGALYSSLRQEFPQLTVLGGCCGTDHRHVQQIARACVS